MPLKLVSVNIERSKHLPRLADFLHAVTPDVICLQEICERDLEWLAGLIGNGHIMYQPQLLQKAEIDLHPVGIAILANRQLRLQQAMTLDGREPLPPAATGHRESVIFASVADGDGTVYRIGTTHLMVTREGEVTPAQTASVNALIATARAQAKTHHGLVLCGDFNAPRGRASFDALADAFVDNVPSHYTTSIDGGLHRCGPLPGRMVDGMFATRSYSLANVSMYNGVSDHCALVGILSMAPVFAPA